MITKCLNCGGPMTGHRENYQYDKTGLNITLVGVEVHRCKQCGEYEVAIPRIEELERTIADIVVNQQTRLKGSEVRFLRTYLGWSGADFARHFDVSPETVSRWENGREPIGPMADRCLRLAVVHSSHLESYALDNLEHIKKTARRPVRLELRTKKNAWVAIKSA